MTICLAMIVKNESHIIKQTLQNIYEHVPLHYWIISDTGSTDNTKELIQAFFDEKRIPGELICRDWVNFGYNRTELLEYAFQRTDYLFLFDADDSLHGKFELPNILTADAYLCKFLTSGGSYFRPVIISNRKPWKFTGVLHEFLDTSEVREGSILHGQYYIESGRTSSRNMNPKKYLQDAELLLKEIKVETDEKLRTRYTYFCAQSYRDYGDVESAITWYQTFLNEQGSQDDRYEACMSLAELYQKKNDFLNVIKYFSMTAAVDPDRIEGIVLLMKQFFENKNHIMVNILFHKFKNYSKTTAKQVSKSMFQEQLYSYQLEVMNSISAPLVGDVVSGYDCCKKVILHSPNHEHKNICIQLLTQTYKPQYDKDPVFKAMVERIKVR